MRAQLRDPEVVSARRACHRTFRTERYKGWRGAHLRLQLRALWRQGAPPSLSPPSLLLIYMQNTVPNFVALDISDLTGYVGAANAVPVRLKPVPWIHWRYS